MSTVKRTSPTRRSASSPSPIPHSSLTVHPTTVALRQFQRRQLEKTAFFDSRGHITFSALLRECAAAALTAPINHSSLPLRPPSDLDRELAIVEAVAAFRTTKAGRNGILSALAPTALEETLAQLIDTISPLADHATDFLVLLARDTRTPKNPELAALYAAYARVCQSLGVADDATLNAAILALLDGPRHTWPRALREATSITFSAIRWVAPFQESVIQALASRLGDNNVTVHHILTDYEQDWWGGALLGNAGRLLFGDAESVSGDCASHSNATRSAIEGLLSLREGYAMQDRALAAQARDCVAFSCSVGTYGEIEDLARRIAWELQDRPDPLRPEDICLVTRNLGAASDAIINVFSRFGIPYYFRRGVPVLSVPIIKSLINLARLSATRERDLFCALLQSPWMNWNPTPASPLSHQPSTSNHSFNPAQLADDILRSGVEPVMDDPDRIARRLAFYVRSLPRHPARETADAYASQAIQAFRTALGKPAIQSVEAGLSDLLARCNTFRLPSATERARLDSQQTSHDDPALQDAGLLNAKAWETAADTLETLRRHALVNRNDGLPATWDEIVDLLNRALQNLTVSATPPDESGVWILNPYDIAGLRFKLVLVAGLNAGAFPKSPAPSPLFPDAELLSFREKLLSTPRSAPHSPSALPMAALAASRARNSQENLLFLTTLAAARERLVFSYAAHDENGQELTPSVFFSTLWRLVGWPALDPLPADPPDPYDRWRLTHGIPHLLSHWQQSTPAAEPFKRRPFAGESYLGTIPLPLCRADDEHRQRIAHSPSPTSATGHPSPDTRHPSPLPLHISRAIGIERQRQAFFARQNQAAGESPAAAAELASTPGHEFAGVLNPALWSSIRPHASTDIPDFSPTQLERLVACPYQYYLTYILRAEPIEPNELEPRPEDFGTAIHEIMFMGFRMLQGCLPDNAPPNVAALARTHKRLCVPAWAIRDANQGWRLQESPDRPSHEAIPLVAVSPASLPDVLALFDRLAETMLDWATRGNALWRLGAPEQLNLQRQRIRHAVRNLVRASFDDDSLPEDIPGLGQARRHPALLEHVFDSRRETRHGPSIELSDPANPGRRLRLHGKIDRVDLVFDEDRRLRAAVIVDYKGRSKASLTSADVAAGIATASDCQLPAYTLAAAHALGLPVPHHPSSVPHHPPPVSLLLHYLSYTQSYADMLKQCRNQCIGMEGFNVTSEKLAAILDIHPSLPEAFTASVFAALNRFERGDFAVAPAACDYCDFKGCCRHAASLLAPESTTGGEDT